MAKNNGKNTRAKKRYSYNDRVTYHKDRYGRFVDKFRTRGSYGSVNIDFDKLESAEKRDPKMQYSSGFLESVSDMQRSYVMPDSELKEHSLSFQKGYTAAQQARDKAYNLKY